MSLPQQCGRCGGHPNCPMCRHLHTVGPIGDHYRKVAGISTPKRVTAAAIEDRPIAGASTLACRHLGEPTGQTTTCGGCKGRVELKVMGCSLHGSCTVGRVAPPLACCATCPDRAAPDFTRHLLYYIYPRQGSNWTWNVLRLLERIALFDGRRVVAIATDRTTDPYDHVQEALRGHRCEYIILENDPGLREVKAHEAMFRAVSDLGPGHATLWAHAKGVTHVAGSMAERWASSLYDLYMDHWPLVSRLLAQQPMVGAWKKIGRCWEPHESLSDWHYSGSWHWFRNADLFARDWRRIDRNRWGIEPYPSLHFRQEDAGCIFPAVPMTRADNMYHLPFWKRFGPQLDVWRQANARYRWEVPYEPAV